MALFNDRMINVSSGKAAYERSCWHLTDRYRPLLAAADVDDGCSSCFNDMAFTPAVATEMVDSIDTVLLRVWLSLVHSSPNLAPANSCCCCCCCCVAPDVTAVSRTPENASTRQRHLGSFIDDIWAVISFPVVTFTCYCLPTNPLYYSSRSA